MSEIISNIEMTPANDAGMNYQSICEYVKTQMENRQEEMKGITHTYVTSMRRFATNDEIVYCVMREMMSKKSTSSSTSIDVDDQAPVIGEGKSNSNTVGATTKKSTRMAEDDLVNLAIETVKGLPLPNGVNSKFSHYASYVLKKNNGELTLEKSEGWNMDVENLKTLESIHQMRMEEQYKNIKTVIAGEYHVYLLYGGKCQVTHFNLAEDVEPYVNVYDTTKIPSEIKMAVEEAKELAATIDSLSDNSNCESNLNGESVVGPSVTASASDESTEAPKEDSTSEEQHLIEKAVEMTKSAHVGTMTDKTAPYYIQDVFAVTDSGELERANRPFSRNIRLEEFDKFKETHKKSAQTYNASYVSCSDDYIAYITNEGRSVNVYYYNKMDSGTVEKEVAV